MNKSEENQNENKSIPNDAGIERKKPAAKAGLAEPQGSDEHRKEMMSREAENPGGAEEAAGTKNKTSNKENNTYGATPSTGDVENNLSNK